MKQYYSAISDLTRTIKIRSEDPQLYYKRGLAYYNDEQYELSINDFKHSLKCKPFPTYKPDIYYHLGIAYANLEKFEKSIDPLSKCIDLCPNEAVYYHERAKAYQMLDEYAKSLEDFNVVIRLQPNNAHAYFRRAFTLKSLRRYHEAAEDFNVARSLQPKNPALLINPKRVHGVRCIVLCKPGMEPKF
jgi:tetratricopeptide (TPR) repeat protein